MRDWWREGIIYQVYPRSFQDSDGDGVGDLSGITRRLPYLSSLGVAAAWVSPFYPSPMVDFGYDISDYTGVDPTFGTLHDFDQLMAEADRLGLRIILDLVPNHTSDAHPWFIASRSGREDPKRDWYLWQDPAPGGGPPNNWVAHFGGSGWEFDEQTEQFYYHSYLPQQPDLNWRNPEVRAAMFEVMRFWLDRGVAGFRVDVMWELVKDELWRDDPLNPEWVPSRGPYHRFRHVYSADRPEVHGVVREMRRVLAEYGEDRVLIGEIYLPLERLVAYYGSAEDGTDLPLNFQLIQRPWTGESIKDAIDTYEDLLPRGGWPNWVLGNHDKSRIASRVGPEQSRIAAIVLLTLRGTPTMYYGDEIGMQDVPIPPARVRDPYEKRVPGLGLGRDPQRTPMQWAPGANAGFTSGEPWLPIAEDHGQANVETEGAEAGSLLDLYRRLIEVREAEPALRIGEYHGCPCGGKLLAYERSLAPDRFLVILNLSPEPQRQTFDGPGTVVVSTHRRREGQQLRGAVELRADEGVVLRLG